MTGLALDPAGDVIVTNESVLRIAPNGTVQVIGPDCCLSAFSAYHAAAGAVAVDPGGNIYVTNQSAGEIREIDPRGVIAIVAGTVSPTNIGDGGPATNAQFLNPEGLAADREGNVYIADYSNSRVRKVARDGTITTIAGNGTAGFSGDGGPAVKAQINGPVGLAVDLAGNLLIADAVNNRVRRVAADGAITTIAGGGPCCNLGDGGQATNAVIAGPYGIAIDHNGAIYVTEFYGNRVRKITPDGIISTLAGIGTRGYSGDGGPATQAQLNVPWGLAVDSMGNVVVADDQNLRLRKISPAGIITTLIKLNDTPTAIAADAAGNILTPGFMRISPEGAISNLSLVGPPVISTSSLENGIAIDPLGEIFIADTGDNVIEALRPEMSRRR
ncbi:MAG TPA: hypothetical protein VN841_19260 [Bryobacteraceae bacterium]|nr:hypothetical protein [Bryobacteraceae bacterium]